MTAPAEAPQVFWTRSPAGTPPTQLRGRRLAAWVVVPLVLSVVLLAVAAASPVVAAWLLGAVLVAWLLPQRVTVRADGIELESILGRRVLPFAAISHVTWREEPEEPVKSVLTLHSGDEVELAAHGVGWAKHLRSLHEVLEAKLQARLASGATDRDASAQAGLRDRVR
ncbi:MAG: hypothetical protein JNJ54_01495 [Myxococcaceae bacterium]|nr:hypothetical protein [Myxococcaceae bacterium]